MKDTLNEIDNAIARAKGDPLLVNALFKAKEAIIFQRRALKEATVHMGCNTVNDDGSWETVRRGVYDFPSVDEVPTLSRYLQDREKEEAEGFMANFGRPAYPL